MPAEIASLMIGVLLLLSMVLSVPLFLGAQLAGSTEMVLRVFSNLALIAGGVVGLYVEDLGAVEWKVAFWALIMSGAALVLWQIKRWSSG